MAKLPPTFWGNFN